MESAALDLIERDGLEAFSIRRLAEVLGCQAMSLYHHYPSKAHLMDAMLDRVICSVEFPPSDLPWQERLSMVARDFRRLAMAHRNFFPFMVTHRMNTLAGLGWLNQAIGVFRDGGFDDETSARLFRVFGYYLMGAGLEETSGYDRGPTSATLVSDTDVAREFPNVAAAGRVFLPAERETTFELGLAMFLAEAGRAKPVS